MNYVTADHKKPIGFPVPYCATPRARNQPRYVSEEGFPIWRVSYTDVGGDRHLTMIAKPNRSWAQVWAARLGREWGWTKITIGKWHGGLDMKPSVFVPGARP